MIDPTLLAVAAEDDRDSPRGSAYASKKDIKWMLLGVAGLLVILYPAYVYMKGFSNVHVCSANMNALFQAVSLYAQDNEGRFPPVAEEADPRTGAPSLVNGRLSTWMSQAFRFQPKMSTYVCPASEDDEAVVNEGRLENPKTHEMETVTFRSTYGMYRPYGGAVAANVEKPGQTLIIAETSNLGSQGSFDPHPFTLPGNGQSPYDGYVIGWDTGNVSPLEFAPALKPGQKAPPPRVSRLAFRNVGPSGNMADAYGRHDFIHGISADGSLIRVKKSDAVVALTGNPPRNLWTIPPLLGR